MTISTLELTQATKDALATLARLGDEQVHELSQRLGEVPVQVFPGPEALQRVEGISGLEGDDDAKNIAALVLQLLWSQSSRKRSVTDLADELIDAFSKADKPQSLSPQKLQTLRGRLEQLLSINNLLVSQNASSLLLEYERVFSVSRVVTDIRPVFEGLKTETVAGGLVVHTLRITYYKPDGETEEFYVAMDDEDLSQLGSMVERAKSKSAQLRTVLNDRAKIPYIPKAKNPK